MWKTSITRTSIFHDRTAKSKNDMAWRIHSSWWMTSIGFAEFQMHKINMQTLWHPRSTEDSQNSNIQMSPQMKTITTNDDNHNKWQQSQQMTTIIMQTHVRSTPSHFLLLLTLTEWCLFKTRSKAGHERALHPRTQTTTMATTTTTTTTLRLITKSDMTKIILEQNQKWMRCKTRMTHTRGQIIKHSQARKHLHLNITWS